MPAMLDDPTSPPIKPKTPTPKTLTPIPITLKDSSAATILPFTSVSQVPVPLLTFLCTTLNAEILAGDTYPMTDPLPLSAFGPYWFALFGAVVLAGKWESVDDVQKAVEEKGWVGEEAWRDVCLGSFYIKPNYPGRSSHVCNAGFLVGERARGKGVGGEMGRAYLRWAPVLGYKYSVFNLVYETNVASCRIWDSLGFERIGRVRKCGDLKSFPGRLIDAIQYGYDFEKAAEEAEAGGNGVVP